MNASPEDQLRLLDVQELDSTLDRLEHRRTTLPELAEIDTLTERATSLGDEIVMAETEDSDLGREQAKVDTDVEQVRARMTRDQQRLDSGAVTNPKDLERLQHELVSLERRISDLEDAELDVMERLEATQTALAELQAQVTSTEGRAAELTEARDKRVAQIREEAERVARERAAAVQGMPEDLLALYERLREQKGGIGAALLRARQCEGCRMQLDNAVLASIAKQPSDEVVRCEECSRILVRTGESGL